MAFAITRPLQRHKGEAVASINKKANEQILRRYPQHKQINMLTRATELQSLNMTGSEEWVAIQSAWDWVRLVVELSNTATAEVERAIDVVDVRSAELRFEQRAKEL